jgi:hypothetical protein
MALGAAAALKVSIAIATLFPAEITPPHPVSTPAVMAADSRQSYPSIATNGDIALAAWADDRDAVTRVYATRLDRSGKALDPFGILLTTGYPAAVLWNGREFVVVCPGKLPNGTELIFVDTEGRITHSKQFGRPLVFGAATQTPSGLRVLFIEWPPNPEESPSMIVVDGEGNLTAGPVRVTGPRPGVNFFAVGQRASEFLFLSDLASPSGIWARRIGINGDVLSSADSGLPDVLMYGDMLAGGANGYVYLNGNKAYHLDTNGVFTGVATTLTAEGPVRQAIAFADGDRYVVVATSDKGGGADANIGAIAASEMSVALRPIAHWSGRVDQVALAAKDGHAILTSSVFISRASSHDLYAQSISSSLDASEPQPVALTATPQSNAHVAISKFGYAVTWSENGPDEFTHHYVRRFSFDGKPVDVEPFEIARAEPYIVPFFTPAVDTRIVSNGDAYVVAWLFNAGWKFRRLLAESGEWLDADPILIGASDLELASNGDDVMATYIGNQRSLHVVQIRMKGLPALGADFTIGSDARDPAIASDGTNYLVVWLAGSGPNNILPWPVEPRWKGSRLLARRVAPDGAPLDAALLKISDGQTAGFPAVASTGADYLVWSGIAARVTKEGVIGPRVATEFWGKRNVLAFGHDYLVFMQSSTYDKPEVLWTAIRFHESAPLASVAAIAPTLIVRRENWRFGDVAAATDGARLILVYDEVSDASLGRVPRITVRQFSAAVR